MKQFSFFFSAVGFWLLPFGISAQAPIHKTSSQIYQQIKKLDVYGSVLYIAAHPDDENTRLLSWLANEKLVRTGYLSLTRGDGGQNLIGSEQGIDLGLIRTQELLSARAIDGAEQFFTRAYDFGYSKSPEEAMRIWGHDKILSDVVFTIRSFRPDVIITRFPTTGEGGHGHHTASAILAEEAFKAAADPNMFPEQNLPVWQAKHLLWNTFNFGGNNTTREDQLRVDCGNYNPVLGMSYGEMAAESRSRHKSQGFGVAATRGTAYEYFKPIAGEPPVHDLFDGINITSGRTEVNRKMESLTGKFNFEKPSEILPALTDRLRQVRQLSDTYWLRQKEAEIISIFDAASGLFLEASSPQQITAVGDTLTTRYTVNNRNGIVFEYLTNDINSNARQSPFDTAANNNKSLTAKVVVPKTNNEWTQPYWLRLPKDIGSFNMPQTLAVSPAIMQPYAQFSLGYMGQNIVIPRKLIYKFTDPVKAEIYEPTVIADLLSVSVNPKVLVPNNKRSGVVTVSANAAFSGKIKVFLGKYDIADTMISLKAGQTVAFERKFGTEQTASLLFPKVVTGEGIVFEKNLKSIKYDHIPDIFYQYRDSLKLIHTSIQIAGKHIGYIPGAGDQIPEALRQMGYEVEMLDDNDISASNLTRFDAVVTGVRAYNTNPRLQGLHSVLMKYVENGGVLVNQYNTNNNLGSMRAQIGPYPFSVTNTRVTDEQSPVSFALPSDPILNFPNKITAADFEGWIQERSIYHAETSDVNYRKPLLMNDPGEKEQGGGLIVANYGKGKYVYTGLAFFRELPAGVPGAYRLFANLVANSNVR